MESLHITTEGITPSVNFTDPAAEDFDPSAVSDAEKAKALSFIPRGASEEDKQKYKFTIGRVKVVYDDLIQGKYPKEDAKLPDQAVGVGINFVTGTALGSSFAVRAVDADNKPYSDTVPLLNQTYTLGADLEVTLPYFTQTDPDTGSLLVTNHRLVLATGFRMLHFSGNLVLEQQSSSSGSVDINSIPKDSKELPQPLSATAWDIRPISVEWNYRFGNSPVGFSAKVGPSIFVSSLSLQGALPQGDPKDPQGTSSIFTAVFAGPAMAAGLWADFKYAKVGLGVEEVVYFGNSLFLGENGEQDNMTLPSGPRFFASIGAKIPIKKSSR